MKIILTKEIERFRNYKDEVTQEFQNDVKFELINDEGKKLSRNLGKYSMIFDHPHGLEWDILHIKKFLDFLGIKYTVEEVIIDTDKKDKKK